MRLLLLLTHSKKSADGCFRPKLLMLYQWRKIKKLLRGLKTLCEHTGRFNKYISATELS